MDILAIDPGQSIGIAVKIAGSYNTCTLREAKDLYALILSHNWGVVVYEKFISSGMISKFGLYTIELVGAIQALCTEHNINCCMHTPIMRKTFQQDAKAKASSKVDHEVDAMAHLLKWEYDNMAQKEIP